MAEPRSPLKGKPLRNPGQSVHEQRVDIVFDKLIAPMFVTLLLVVWPGMDLLRYFVPSKPNPWVSGIIAV